MKSKKYINIDLDDTRIKDLADVISNKTSKKILDYLSEKEASEAEISRDLNLPANTVNYNVAKLVKTGLIEKTKTYFWSVKGKKIPTYRVANKSIVISPKNSKQAIKVLITLAFTGIVALAVNSYNASKTAVDEGVSSLKTFDSSQAVEVAGVAVSQTVQNPPSNLGLWFLLGGLTALVIYAMLNWKNIQKMYGVY